MIFGNPRDFLMDPWGDDNGFIEQIAPPSVTEKKIAELAEVLKTFPLPLPEIQERKPLIIAPPISEKKHVAQFKDASSAGSFNSRKRPRQIKKHIRSDDPASNGVRKYWPRNLQNLTESLATIGVPCLLIKNIIENSLGIQLSSHGRKTVSKWYSKIFLKGKIDNPVLNAFHKNVTKVEQLAESIRDELLKSHGSPILDEINDLFKKALQKKP
jgi:hypothetical protein